MFVDTKAQEDGEFLLAMQGISARLQEVSLQSFTASACRFFYRACIMFLQGGHGMEIGGCFFEEQQKAQGFLSAMQGSVAQLQEVRMQSFTCRANRIFSCLFLCFGVKKDNAEGSQSFGKTHVAIELFIGC